MPNALPSSVPSSSSFPFDVESAEDIMNSCSTDTQESSTYLIENLLKVGDLTILAGGPKSGKTLLALLFSVAVALGRKLSNVLSVSQSDVVFISLEETREQLAPKLRLIADGGSLTPLGIVTTCPTLKRGGLIALERYLEQAPNTKLVVIDIWNQFRGESASGGSYKNEYKDLTEIREFAQRMNVAVLLLHHVTKSNGKNWMNNLYGSNGMTGAVDGVMLLERETPTSPDAVLHVTGRDIPAQDWSLEFDPERIQWSFTRQPLAKTPEQQDILEYLSHGNGPLRLATIHADTRKGTKQNTQKLLTRLVDDGLVEKPSYGTYQLSSRAMEFFSERAVDSVELVDAAPLAVEGE